MGHVLAWYWHALEPLLLLAMCHKVSSTAVVAKNKNKTVLGCGAHIADPRSGALGRLAAVVGGTDGLLRNTTSDALLGEKPGPSPSEIGLLAGIVSEKMPPARVKIIKMLQEVVFRP